MHQLCAAVKRLLPAVLLLVLVMVAFGVLSKDATQRTRQVSYNTLATQETSKRKTAASLDPPQPKITFRPGAFDWLYDMAERRGQVDEGDGSEAGSDAMPTFIKADIESKYQALLLGGDHKNDRWIVLTTVQAPTNDVKFLADIQDWQVVVVGDTKTPVEWSWPNCHFISVDFQESMGLRLPNVLAYQSYSRKNAGYLYAIAHGAREVYETDDDNRPFDNLTSFQYGPNVSGLMFAGSRLFNAYQYFGQSTLWQRGFPLRKVAGKIQNEFRLSPTWATPSIQQGVVNGDPDVDAVLRLTRKFSDSKLDVTFDPAGPPVILPPGVFSPTNTQNTLFRYEAFWGLFIPTSLNFRTCDIWRGYGTQRLLWEIGGFQGFYPPNAFQIRNNHDLMVDMSEENEMYFTSDALLDFLYAWTCPQDLRFFQCVYKLMVDMVEKGDMIFAEKDVAAIKVWLEDLIVLGYEEPKRVKFDVLENQYNGEAIEKRRIEILKGGTLVQYAPSEMDEPTISWQPRKLETSGWRFVEGVSSYCPKIESFPKEFVFEIQKAYEVFRNVLLIVYTSPADVDFDYRAVIENMEFYYRPVFPNMGFCGDDADKFQKDSELLSGLRNKQTFIELAFESKSAEHVCMTKALQMNYNVAGYLMIRKDVILSPWSMLDLRKDKVWIMTHYGNDDSPEHKSRILGGPSGKTSYEKAINTLSSGFNLEIHKESEIRSPSEFVAAVNKLNTIPLLDASVVYIPNRLRKSAEFYLSHFISHGVASEISIPSIMTGIEDNDVFNVEKSLSKFGVRSPEIILSDRTNLCGFISQEIAQFMMRNKTNGLENNSSIPS